MTNQQGAPEALRPIARYKIGYHTDEWGVLSSTPGGIADPAGQWVRYEDHLAALASHGQAPAQAAHSSAAQTANCTYPACQIASGCGGTCGRQLAQAAPAAVAGPSISQVTEQMRAAGDHAWMTSDGVDSARVFWAMLAAAPTTQPAPMESVLIDGIAYQTPAPVAAELLRLHIDARQPAPQQEAQEPVAWAHASSESGTTATWQRPRLIFRRWAGF